VNVLEYILEGLEAELELERELGVRSIEIDRNMLASQPPVTNCQPSVNNRQPPTVNLQPPAVDPQPPVVSSKISYDFVFIHDRPLSEKGIAMMAKIVPAMGKTPETAPVIIAPPIPQAKIYVFLGRAALAKYMPDVRAKEGVWFKSPKGKEIMLVKSPEEILRFDTVSPAVEKMKRDMWQSLKVVMQRVRAGI